MKKIKIRPNKLFLISKILKEKLPQEKIYIHQKEETLTIQLNKKLDKFLLREIQTLIKIKFPAVKIVFEDYLTKD